MMKWIGILAALLAPAWALLPQPSSAAWSVTSPDGRTAIAVSRRADGALQYRVTRDGQIVLGDAPLGLRRADARFDTRLTYQSAGDVRAIDERYSLPHGKRHEHHIVARERVLTFTNPGGSRLDIVLRAQNDGVAFRYRFPESGAGTRSVTEEATGFTVPTGSTAWMLPRQPVGK